MLKVVTVQAAREELARRFGGLVLETETVPAGRACGRYLAEPVSAPFPVPHFRRSTRDGYAVRSRETAGAGETMPAFFRLRPEVEMGRGYTGEVASGEAAYVPTGGMIPPGADAVVMVEYAELLGDGEVALTCPAVPGENVIREGQDIAPGQTVLEPGRRLGPADLGVLVSCGRTEVRVFRKPRAAILSTGDELLPPGAGESPPGGTGSPLPPPPGQVRDLNTLTLTAQAEEMGFQVVHTEILRDEFPLILEGLKRAREVSDLIFLSGGSSAGQKDYTSAAFDRMGSPGTFVHGIAFNPGKPTILADAEGFPLVGLPGHPVSALMVFRIIARDFIRLMNRARPEILSSARALLGENVHASPGRETYRLVTLDPREGDPGYTAMPVHGESGMITMLSQARGYVPIPRDSEGLAAGAAVDVFLL